jgi:hypothetical protein
LGECEGVLCSDFETSDIFSNSLGGRFILNEGNLFAIGVLAGENGVTGVLGVVA